MAQHAGKRNHMHVIFTRPSETFCHISLLGLRLSDQGRICSFDHNILDRSDIRFAVGWRSDISTHCAICMPTCLHSGPDRFTRAMAVKSLDCLFGAAARNTDIGKKLLHWSIRRRLRKFGGPEASLDHQSSRHICRQSTGRPCRDQRSD